MHKMWDIHPLDIDKKNVVYKLTFPDGLIYIGKTTRALKLRLEEHKSKPVSKDRIRKRMSKIEKHIKTYLSSGLKDKVHVEVIGSHFDKSILTLLEVSHITEMSKHFELLNINHVCP